ncbi:MAG: hypothetical protein WCO51_04550 [bacterium]
MIKGLLVVAMFGLLSVVMLSAATFMDAKAERKAAVEAEKAGNWDAALLHYENIYDSTKCDQETWDAMRAKFRELRPKVAPNTDESKAGHWKLRAYLFRTLDLQWKDAQGGSHHTKQTFRDEEIEKTRQALAKFEKIIWKFSWGNLKIDWTLTIIEKPLTTWDDWPDPSVCMPYITDLKPNEADSIFVFVKTYRSDMAKDEPTEDIRLNLLAGTLPPVPSTKGALYIGYLMCDSDGIMYHEFMHASGCAMNAHNGYPDGIFPSSDSLTDCDLLMTAYATRKMWRDLPYTKRVNNPWVDQYCRDILFLGPFDTKGEKDYGINKSFIKETSVKPSVGANAGGNTWRKVSALGYVFDLSEGVEMPKNLLAYAATTVISEKDQFAQLRFGTNDASKVWQDGKLISYMPVEGGSGSDGNIMRVRLKKGTNQFLIKVAKPSGYWQFSFRVCDNRGNPLPSVKYGLPETP